MADASIKNSTDDSLWCVCWAAQINPSPFRQYRGPPVSRAEAESRMAWGRETYPQIIYWLERAGGAHG